MLELSTECISDLDLSIPNVGGPSENGGMENATISAPGDDAARVESLLDALAETRRKLSVLHAEQAALLAEAVRWATDQNARDEAPSGSDIPLRSIAAQIAVTLRVSDRTVQRRLGEADILLSRFPVTFAALSAGEIDRSHVLVIVEAGLAIGDDDARAAYEDAVVVIARRETPGRLRPAARTLAQRLHPVPLAERHRAAAANRDVWVRDGDDGMAELIALLPATIAHGIHDRITQLARTTLDATGGRDTSVADDDSPGSRDTRRIGEVRADALADVLLTGHATAAVSAASTPVAEAITAHVQITIPVLTLLGADTTPAELTGRHPIDTATALRLAGAASGWDRVLTHPVSGGVLAVDRYRPTEHLRRTLRVRDEHCRFPGCRMPTRRCDIDHTIAREHDGPTEIHNLAHLCRRHHVLKHQSAWRVKQHPDGTLEWTTPTGRIHPDAPARTLVFTSGESPPGAVPAGPHEPAPF